jgi:hypothetical protein
MKNNSYTFYLKISATGKNPDVAFENAINSLVETPTATPGEAAGPEAIYSEMENYGACYVKDEV